MTHRGKGKEGEELSVGGKEKKVSRDTMRVKLQFS
jgi:hypothetical protein